MATMDSTGETALAENLLIAESLASLSLNNNNDDDDKTVSTAARTATVTERTQRAAVLFQPACTNHRYIRTKDNSTIVERPERIRAVKTGVAAAYARLEAALPKEPPSPRPAADDDDLDALLSGLSLDSKRDSKGKQRAREIVDPRGPFDIFSSDAVMSVQDRALRYIHSKPNRAPQDLVAEEEGWESTSSTSSSAVASTSAGPAAAEANPLPPPRTGPAPWPEQLQSLCRASSALLSSPATLTPSSVRRSEIPAHLPQGDLYLCPGSEEAIFGALGACCQAVDMIVQGGRADRAVTAAGENAQSADPTAAVYDRAFVAIRPPGHHCGEANPQGFCFVNNVAVAAAHAHLEHGIDRVVIFDIDLHHGNGTQEIAWRINAEAHEILEKRERARLDAATAAAAAATSSRTSPRKSSPRKSGESATVKKEEEVQEVEPERNPLRIMYASLHDIWSYPCEDGDPALVSAASLNLNGGHGQYISNVHLESWANEEDFHERLYQRYLRGLVYPALDFTTSTRGADETWEDAEQRTLVIVSLGCDASEHESAGMSRHGRNVPTSFYRRFALDAVDFAREHAQGKCLTVLEGGYSDRALASASAAFLAGFTETDATLCWPDSGRGFIGQDEPDRWWAEPQLKKLEKACAVAKGRRAAAAVGSPATLLAGADSSAEPWLVRAVEIFAHLEDTSVAPPPVGNTLAAARSGIQSDPNTPRQLRDRKPRAVNYAQLADVSPIPSPARAPTTIRRSASASRLREAKVETPGEPVLPPPVPSVPTAFLPSEPIATSCGENVSGIAPHNTAFGDVPAASFASATPTSTTEENSASTAKPSIRFTWKQGGFGGEPRM